jgi:sporulation protein YlmC with PRC-barrel domain
MVRRRRLTGALALAAAVLCLAGPARGADDPTPAGAPSLATPPSPPPPPVEPPKAAPKDEVPPPKNLVPIPKDEAITVLGKKVTGPAGEDMGRVVDLLLDRTGQIKSVVIDFGGFLGVGSRKIAIDWQLVHFMPDDKDAPIALGLGKAEVQAAPEYKDSAQPPVMVGPPPPPAPPPAPPPPPPSGNPPTPAPAPDTPTPPAPATDAPR